MFTIIPYMRDQWDQVSKAAFEATFGLPRDPALERYDFTMAAVSEDGSLAGWITCKEMDAETIYWQYGGASPKFSGSSNVLIGYKQFVDFSLKDYKRITTRIENKNLPMLKLAFKLGFIIVGVHHFDNKVFVELMHG